MIWQGEARQGEARLVLGDRLADPPEPPRLLRLQINPAAWGGACRSPSGTLGLPLLSVPEQGTVTTLAFSYIKSSRYITSHYITSHYVTSRSLLGSSFEVPAGAFPICCSRWRCLVLRPTLRLQPVAVADHLQVSPALHVEGRVPAHANLKYRFATANLRKVPHDFIQVGSRHS